MPTLEGHARNLKNVRDLYLSHGHELRFVGGGVRDTLLGLHPKDVDLATTMPADLGMKLLQEQGIHCIATGLSHGTITIVVNHIAYEVTTLRKDVATDGRWAQVHFTDDWQEDAARRDLTINALYQDFEGNLYDYFGGQSDLSKGIIRFIGNPEERILEDYLRILRLFRFYARFGKQKIDEETLLLCRKYAQNLKKLSVERITQEILLLLSIDNCFASMLLMDCYDVLTYIFFSYNINHLERVIRREKEFHLQINPLRRLCAFSLDNRGLRLSRSQLKYLKTLESIEHDYPSLEVECQFYLSEDHPVRGSIHYLCLTIGKERVIDYMLVQFQQLPVLLIQALQDLLVPPFPLKGKDLLAIGYLPGPEINCILSKCQLWWCQKSFEPDYKACLAYVLSQK